MPTIAELLGLASDRTGVSQSYFQRLVGIEASGGDPYAQNPSSSAGGLFQFIDSTWSQYGSGSRFDPVAATNAVIGLTNDNKNFLTRALGRSPTEGELYLAHQQGAQGAVSLLQNPGARAADLVGADAVTLNGGTLEMSAKEFAARWTGEFDGASSGDGNSNGGVASYFIRAVVIILGFIFVAVGLAMFKPKLVAVVPGGGAAVKAADALK